MPETIRLPLFARDAQLRAESFNEADHSIEVVFTAGATVKRRSWMDGDFEEELVVTPESVRLDRLNAGAPFLDSHSGWSLASVIGSVVPGSARIEKGLGLARIQLSQAPGCADQVAKIKEGTVRNISCGYWSHRIEKTEREGRVPLWRVTEWEPLEISAVPIPADPGAQIRSADAGQMPQLYECRIARPAGLNEARRIRMQMRQRQLAMSA